MTLQQLSDAWNTLRNDALGRGTVPRVSPALAKRIGDHWEAFRAWLAEQGALSDVVASFAARSWVETYREDWSIAAHELPGGVTIALPETFYETTTEGASTVATLLLGIAGVVLGAMLFSRRGRS